MSLQSSQEPRTPPDLTLRMAPKPVLRLSRKVLIAGSLLLGLGVGILLIFALQPSKARRITAANEVSSTRNKAVSERVTALPHSYSDIPKLGPPLPGDFGKSLLATNEKDLLSELNPVIGPGPSAEDITRPVTALPPTAPSSHSEAITQGQYQAHNSALFIGESRLQGQGRPPVSKRAAPEAGYIVQDMAVQLADHKALSPSQANAFPERVSDISIISPERLQSPASPYLILAGSVVPAALITGIRSDLPGQVSAQITENVYDSLTGQILLIPQGARLIGHYNNALTFGQSRILLAWTRLILPNGKSMILYKLSASDPQGLAGLSGRVDFHSTDMLKAAALSTLLSIGINAGSSSKDSDIIKAIRTGTADTVSRTGQQIVERQLNIQPTLTIRPGYSVRVILSRDLVLEPYRD